MRKARIISIPSIFILVAFLALFNLSPNTSATNHRVISSVNPSSVKAGASVILRGVNLHSTVQITNVYGGLNSVAGTFSDGTYAVTFTFPSNLPRGTYRIMVGPDAIDVSNEMVLTITEGAKPTITSINPTQAETNKTVTIKGTNLATSDTYNNPLVKLQLGGDTFSAAGSVNPELTEVAFDVPTDAPPGSHTITLTTDDGTATSPTQLKVIEGGSEFTPPPTSTPPTQGLPTNLGQLIEQIFTWSLGILGIAVFVMFFYSGFLWLTAAGNTSKIGEAKTHMTNAVFGAVLLLSSYLILYTINPDFVKNTVNLPGLGGKNNDGGGGGIPCEEPEVMSPDPLPTMQQVRSESAFSDLDLKDKSPGGGRDKFTTEVVKRLNAANSKWGRKKSSSGAPISTDSIGYLRPDIGSSRFEAVDTITSGGTLQRLCYGVVGSEQVWVAP